MNTLYPIGTQLGFRETSFLTQVLGTEDNNNELVYRCRGPLGTTIFYRVDQVHRMVDLNQCWVAQPGENPQWLIEWREEAVRDFTGKPDYQIKLIPLFILVSIMIVLWMVMVAIVRDFLTRDFVVAVLCFFIALGILLCLYYFGIKEQKKT